jgi:hypothetical protein
MDEVTVTAKLIDGDYHGGEIRRVDINGHLSFPSQECFEFLLDKSAGISDETQEDVEGHLRIRVVKFSGRVYQDYINMLVEEHKRDTPKVNYV